MNSEPLIRFAEETDKDQVLDLLNNTFKDQQRSRFVRGDAYWKWKFKNNPFGDSILTVTESGGRIVGVDHLWPWEFCYKGNVMKAIQPCDTVVHEDYRGRGLFKKIRNFGLEEAEKQGYSMAFNFPNENSLPGNKSIGADYIGKITWWVNIRNPLNVLKNRVFAIKEKRFFLPEKYRLNTESIDELTSKYEANDNRIKIHRIPGFHKWRYADHPSRTYGMLNISEENKHTIVVFTINTKGSTREMVIVDLIGMAVPKSILAKAIKKAGREVECDFIAVMNNNQFGIEKLWKSGFVKKRLKNMVVKPLNNKIDVNLSSMANWNMVAGMHDSI